MPLRTPQNFSLWHICRSWWLCGERCRKTKFSASSSTASHSCARSVCCFCVHSLSSDKERTKKTTRASNSVLMGKLNYPLPKNFACKILPIENKIFLGLMPLRTPQNFSLWHICRSWWLCGERCLKNFYVFLVLLFVERHRKGGPGGNVRADFLWYFLCSATKKVQRKPAQRGAKLYARPATKS